ncbi:coil containing protein [Vibrio phage LP.2]|nr:coil containing protein [Vibrio phage LP.2]
MKEIVEKYKKGELTLYEFLDAGYQLEAGVDQFKSFDGMSIVLSKGHVDNMMMAKDKLRIVVKSKQLDKEIAEMERPELTKEDSPQCVLSRISNRLHNIGCEHQDSELGEELGGMACEMWKVLPMIYNEEQPKQYKYEQVDAGDKEVWEILKEYGEDSEWYTAPPNEGGVAIPNWFRVAERISMGRDMYRRIELTQEELEAQKVEELAKMFYETYQAEKGRDKSWVVSDGNPYRDIAIKQAKDALEWMKQEW